MYVYTFRKIKFNIQINPTMQRKLITNTNIRSNSFDRNCALASCTKLRTRRVWAVDDGEKIHQEDINNPLATDENNSVWKNNL